MEHTLWEKIWYFLWEDNSVWSWIVNVVLAFLLIKFIVYPGLGMLFGTPYPIVAVISSSMEHDGNFASWWGAQQRWYAAQGITEADFQQYPFRNGFRKGDIMVLVGRPPETLRIGDVIVFASALRPEPIIHRIVGRASHPAFGTIFQTKGDHNAETFPFEQQITPPMIYGRALFRIPLLGYVKIIAVELLNLVR